VVTGHHHHLWRGKGGRKEGDRHGKKWGGESVVDKARASERKTWLAETWLAENKDLARREQKKKSMNK